MSTSTTADTVNYPTRTPRPPSRLAVGAFVVISLLSGVISASVNAPMEDQFEHDARVLITTFGLGMAALSLAVVLGPFRRGERWAWATLWVWPAFFVAHVVTLGTVVPDGVFAVATAVALVASRPRP